jgi:hypothetical protein
MRLDGIALDLRWDSRSRTVRDTRGGGIQCAALDKEGSLKADRRRARESAVDTLLHTRALRTLYALELLV